MIDKMHWKYEKIDTIVYNWFFWISILNLWLLLLIIDNDKDKNGINNKWKYTKKYKDAIFTRGFKYLIEERKKNINTIKQIINKEETMIFPQIIIPSGIESKVAKNKFNFKSDTDIQVSKTNEVNIIISAKNSIMLILKALIKGNLLYNVNSLAAFFFKSVIKSSAFINNNSNYINYIN